MEETIKLEIVTPEHRLVSDEVTEVTVPGRGGYLGILPGHAPLISELAVGEIAYRLLDGTARYLSCAWGFVEVLPDKVTILAEIAELAEEIDVGRARAALERAEEHLKTIVGTEEYERAHADLLRASARLDVASKISPPLANLLP
jgi:F-type H+-transporting ATPase subunit epsilon